MSEPDFYEMARNALATEYGKDSEPHREQWMRVALEDAYAKGKADGAAEEREACLALLQPCADRCGHVACADRRDKSMRIRARGNGGGK